VTRRDGCACPLHAAGEETAIIRDAIRLAICPSAKPRFSVENYALLATAGLVEETGGTPPADPEEVAALLQQDLLLALLVRAGATAETEETIADAERHANGAREGQRS